MIIVANSSPLISLAILSRLDLLTELFDEIYIPQAVFIEITESEKPYSEILTHFGKSRVRSIQNTVALSILSHELDCGEAEAIVLALEKDVENILMDEHKGRNIAIANGLHPIGTIGVLLQAKKRDLIKKVKPCLDTLIENNIYISKALYSSSLKVAGEE